LKGVGGIP
jgi:regulator of protease activity HflC (stomatin/prohibitin superfamily)